MDLSAKEYQHLVQEIARETGAKRDGTGKNLIVPRCPFCGKSGGKFGIYIGPETARREPFMAHCFSCGKSTRTLGQLLEAIGRMDLMVTPTADITAPLQFVLGVEPEEIDDMLTITTTECHFTSELRIYASSTHNGYAIGTLADGKTIKSLGFNAGYKVDTLNVYGSTDGSTWTKIEGVKITSTTYSDYSVDFGNTK
jgi:hypothetical protein